MTKIDALQVAEPFKTSQILVQVNNWLQAINNNFPGTRIDFNTGLSRPHTPIETIRWEMDDGSGYYDYTLSVWQQLEESKQGNLLAGVFYNYWKYGSANLDQLRREQKEESDRIAKYQINFLDILHEKYGSIRTGVANLDAFLAPYNRDYRSRSSIPDDIANKILGRVAHTVHDIEERLREVAESVKRTTGDVAAVRNIEMADRLPRGRITIDRKLVDPVTLEQLNKSPIFQQALKQVVATRNANITIHMGDDTNITTAHFGDLKVWGYEGCASDSTPCHDIDITITNDSPPEAVANIMAHEIIHAWFFDDHFIPGDFDKKAYVHEAILRELRTDMLAQCVSEQSGFSYRYFAGTPDLQARMDAACKQYREQFIDPNEAAAGLLPYLPKDFLNNLEKQFGHEWDDAHSQDRTGVGVHH